MSAKNSTDGLRVFIGLGSNIDPRRNLRRGVEALAKRVDVLAASPVYETDPIGAPGAPMFLNAAVLVRTDLDSQELKEALRALEEELGRVRVPGRKDAPREIDFDLLLYGDEVVRDGSGAIRIPHPDIAERAYVALPLADVGADVVHPLMGTTLGEIAGRFARSGGVRLIDLELAP